MRYNPIQITLLLLILLFPSAAHSLSISAKPPTHLPGRGDGAIVLYSYPHKEVLQIRYRKIDNQPQSGGEGGTQRALPVGGATQAPVIDGAYDIDALKQIAHLMRSPDGAEAPIATALIELIDTIQDTFKAGVVEIISGYRSPAYNTALKEAGRHVARESLHTQGLAADIHLDEITEKAVRNFAVSLKRGGVGYYPGLNFVHVDLGEVRQWEEAEGARKLIGTEANTGPCNVTTDRNVYLEGAGKEINVTIAGSVLDCGELKRANFESFNMGRWIVSPHAGSFILKKQPRPCSIKPGENVRCADYIIYIHGLSPGKYRILATTSAANSPTSRSNEFYIKKE